MRTSGCPVSLIGVSIGSFVRFASTISGENKISWRSCGAFSAARSNGERLVAAKIAIRGGFALRRGHMGQRFEHLANVRNSIAGEERGERFIPQTLVAIKSQHLLNRLRDAEGRNLSYSRAKRIAGISAAQQQRVMRHGLAVELLGDAKKPDVRRMMMPARIG